MPPISICILTKNNETKIRRCLELLHEWDDVLVLDTGSTDKTLDIVASFSHVRLFHQDGIENFGLTRNFITAQAKNDWVLHLDSDEFVTEAFLKQLRLTALRDNTVYAILLRIVYRGQILPPFDYYTVRLYNRTQTSWSNRAVHESILVPPNFSLQKIHESIEHHSFDSIDQMFRKSLWYSSLFVQQFGEEKTCSACSSLWHALAMFLKFYIIRGAFLYGYNGFIISFRQSVETALKYAKLFEATHKS